MNDNAEITTKVLLDIRDEIRGMRSEVREDLAAVHTELRDIHVTLHDHSERLDRIELKVAAQTGVIQKLVDKFEDYAGLRDAYVELERRVKALETRRAG